MSYVTLRYGWTLTAVPISSWMCKLSLRQSQSISRKIVKTMGGKWLIRHNSLIVEMLLQLKINL